MIRAWLLSISDVPVETILTKMLVELPAVQQEKIQNIKQQEKQVLSCGAWYLLKYALKEMELSELYEEIHWNEFGKPYFEDDSYHFNLSHAGERILCVVSNKKVGCDVEYKRRHMPNMKRHFFHEVEADGFQYLSKGKQETLFYEVWTKKESFIKWLGTGLSYPMTNLLFLDRGEVASEWIHEEKKVYLKTYQENNYFFSFATALSIEEIPVEYIHISKLLENY